LGIGYWLLGIGYWEIGYWGLVIGDWEIGYWETLVFKEFCFLSPLGLTPFIDKPITTFL
jgi:hypothetical protein